VTTDPFTFRRRLPSTMKAAPSSFALAIVMRSGDLEARWPSSLEATADESDRNSRDCDRIHGRSFGTKRLVPAGSKVAGACRSGSQAKPACAKAGGNCRWKEALSAKLR